MITFRKTYMNREELVSKDFSFVTSMWEHAFLVVMEAVSPLLS
jgi:hypothetical protein